MIRTLLLGLALTTFASTASASGPTCQQVKKEANYFLGLWADVDNPNVAANLASRSLLSDDALYWSLRDREISVRDAKQLMANRLIAYRDSCIQVK